MRQLETVNIKCYLHSVNFLYKRNYKKGIKIKVNVVQNHRGRVHRMDRSGAWRYEQTMKDEKQGFQKGQGT